MRPLLLDLRPLRRREVRLLLAGQATTFLGAMITYVAVPYQVYSLTGSTLVVGLLGLVELVAILLTGLLGGAIADAVDRRAVVRLTEAGLGLCASGLLLNALGPQSVPLVFVLAGVMAVCDSLQRPSLDALAPRLVPREELMAMSALGSLRVNTGLLVGPALGGLLLAVGGLPLAYGVDLATYVVSVLALSLMRPVPAPADAPRPSVAGVVEGLHYARSRPELMGTYVVDIAAMLLAMPYALFPAFAQEYGGPAALGLLYSAPAVGSLLVTALSGAAQRVHHHGRGVLWAAGAWGLAIAGFGLMPGLTPALWPALLLLAVAGGADTVSGLYRSTIWNTTIPDSLRGRLAGVELISYSAGPTLGQTRAGLGASVTSPAVATVSGGLLCVVAVAALAAVLPGLRDYDAREWVDAPG